MAENGINRAPRRIRIRHRGRAAQVGIYFGKLLRMFVYQNDWKVLPMAALIAGLVGMVIRKRMFINMEGTLMGAFALVCVCIWNGCFNSIQVICRERDVIKREHRSGMHISSYIFSHMLYQALLCLGQTAVTLYVTWATGVQYPATGELVPVYFIEFGISMLLITYASDMLSLWVSTLARNTTTAMTIMPFVLIFQLVFSGGMLKLPAWTESLTHFTISNPGLKVIATQADTNHRPYATIASMVSKMRDSEVGGSVTVGQVMDLLSDESNPMIAELREKRLGGVFTLGELKAQLESSRTFETLRGEQVLPDLTVGDALRAVLEAEQFAGLRDYDFGVPGFTFGKLLKDICESEQAGPLLEKKLGNLTTVGDVLDAVDAAGIMDRYADATVDASFTLGQAIDLLAGNPDLQAGRDQKITLKTTVGKLVDLAGEDKVKTFLEQRAAEANYVEDYEYNPENVAGYWAHLMLFILAFAALSTITLEFIDKDKR